MLKVIAALAILAVMAGTSLLTLALVTAGPVGCPTALLQGRLVNAGGTLAVASIEGGAVTHVEWPFGYGVGEEDGRLTLTRVFATVAREGDLVSMGGGEGGPGFRACGPVTPGLAWEPEQSPPQAARAALVMRATAFEPCIPPPSGCGYWVSLTSPGFGTDRAPLEHRRSFESAASADPAPLILGPGLAPGLEPGAYDLRFDVGEFSDAATQEPLDDGTTGYRPRVTMACTAQLVVPPDATSLLVEVEFHGHRCDVRTEVDPPDDPPVTGRASSGAFELVLTLPRSRFRAADTIAGEASLSVTGGTETRISAAGAGPLAFTFAEVGGARRMEAGWDSDCASFTLRPGSPIRSRLTRSGAWGEDDPNAAFYRAFFQAPEIHLPAGTWDISARAMFAEGDCGGPEHDMTATTRVVVDP